MTNPISLLPQYTGSTFPAPNVTGLSDAQQNLLQGLSAKLMFQAWQVRQRQMYYDGLQQLTNIGVLVPAQLSSIRTVVDWPRICVDPLVQRNVVQGFRLPGASDDDAELAELWQANNMDAEAPLCFLDSLVAGRGYMVVGAGDTAGDPPIITAESPLNVAINWDPRTRSGTSGYQAYEMDGVWVAVLHELNTTTYMSRETNTQWAVDKVDNHNFGELTIVRFPNRARTSDREGRSEITPAIMNTTDSVIRTLLGMEIAREFYSVPHRYILGASESDFQNADGTPKTALDLSMNKYLALERDENGEVPTIGQFNAFDPSVFGKIVDTHAQLMSSYTGFPPSYFGLTATANPASADAIRVATNGLDRRATQVQNQNSDPLECVMRLAWRFVNDGAKIPPNYMQLETDWEDASTLTLSATSAAMQLQADMGAVPPTSDPVLKALGWSARDRAQFVIDREKDPGETAIDELGSSDIAKAAIAAGRIEKIIDPNALLQDTPGGAPGQIPAK